MRWNRWYAIKTYFSSALWITPLIALVLENVAIRVVFAMPDRLNWVPRFGITVSGGAEALNTVETLTISFIVFTFGSMLVAIQVAGGQLTPRIIAPALLRNNVIRVTVGLFTFTMMFAVGTGARIDATLYYPAAVAITWLLGICSIVAFLFLIDYTARLLRPISIIWRISEQGADVIESVYTETLDAIRRPRERQALGPVLRTVEQRDRSAVVLAVNLKALVAVAQRADGVVEFVPRVGDFVAAGEALFRLHGGAAGADERILHGQVAFGRERTIEQDSTLAFRVLVDIAIKALSPAINDPTTAVLALDQIHRLLRLVGRRHLHDDALYDPNGTLRVIFPTPNWDDFVRLSVTEVRLYGAGNFQVSRRLRAMLLNLLESLPESRRPVLVRELELLDRMLEKLVDLPEDLEFARQPDFQGIGGSSVR